MRCIQNNKPFMMLLVFACTVFMTSLLMIACIEKYPNNCIKVIKTPHYYGEYYCPICKLKTDRDGDNATCVPCNKKFNIIVVRGK